MNDAVLLRAALDDDSAFERVYRRHAPRLYGILRREASDEVALDLVAETFAQVLISVHRFRGSDDAGAEAWLNGIARNLLRTYRRRERVDNKARRKLEIEEAVRAALAVSRASPDCDDLNDAVEGALLGLPPSEREAIELRVVREMSYDAVAAALRIQPEAARMRVSRGLRAMALQLRGDAA